MWTLLCGLALGMGVYLLLGGERSGGRRGAGVRIARGCRAGGNDSANDGNVAGSGGADVAGVDGLGGAAGVDSAEDGGSAGGFDLAGFLRSFARRRLAKMPAVRKAIEQERLSRLSAVCEKEMPELLDILALGLSAGLSFDASLELYCERRQGALSREVWGAMSLWRMGVKGRSEALEELSAGVGSPSLERFCAAVREALSFGSPLAQTLERQADAIRAEQRSLTEERIEQVPVRMLVPLGTLVVPAMLLAILGPLLSGALAM